MAYASDATTSRIKKASRLRHVIFALAFTLTQSFCRAIDATPKSGLCFVRWLGTWLDECECLRCSHIVSNRLKIRPHLLWNASRIPYPSFRTAPLILQRPRVTTNVCFKVMIFFNVQWLEHYNRAILSPPRTIEECNYLLTYLKWQTNDLSISAIFHLFPFMEIFKDLQRPLPTFKVTPIFDAEQYVCKTVTTQ